MKKTLLVACLSIGVAFGVSAENRLFENDQLGEVTGISENGQYAVVSDNANNKAFLWDATNPEVFTELIITAENSTNIPNLDKIDGVHARGVSNDGTIVGCIFYRDATGTQLSVIYKNGEWSLLPYDSASYGGDTAVAITGDGKVIGGMQFIMDPDKSIHGGYWPVQWFLQEDGSYELKAYTDIDIPSNQQGFWVVSQSPKTGDSLAGWLYCGVGSFVPAIVHKGELKIFCDIQKISEPWMFRGKYYAGLDENGKQIWVEDVNDPRVVLFDSWYLDGFKDMSNGSNLQGGFQGIDQCGNFYGFRTIVSDVQEDGSATLTQKAGIYNINTNEWTDGLKGHIYSGGFNQEIIFEAGTSYIANGQNESLYNLGLQASRSVVAVTKTDLEGKVLGGMTSQINPATSENEYYPFVFVLDTPLFSTSGIELVRDEESAVSILLSSGRIDVMNASEVAIYDLDGTLVSTTATSNVAPGIYVVKADKTSKKVIVK